MCFNRNNTSKKKTLFFSSTGNKTTVNWNLLQREQQVCIFFFLFVSLAQTLVRVKRKTPSQENSKHRPQVTRYKFSEITKKSIQMVQNSFRKKSSEKNTRQTTTEEANSNNKREKQQQQKRTTNKKTPSSSFWRQKNFHDVLSCIIPWVDRSTQIFEANEWTFFYLWFPAPKAVIKLRNVHLRQWCLSFQCSPLSLSFLLR